MILQSVELSTCMPREKEHWVWDELGQMADILKWKGKTGSELEAFSERYGMYWRQLSDND